MNNTQTTAKKTWSKPQLLVLVRNRPEEAVLVTCKVIPGVGAGSGPTATESLCSEFDGLYCFLCESLTSAS